MLKYITHPSHNHHKNECTAQLMALLPFTFHVQTNRVFLFARPITGFIISSLNLQRDVLISKNGALVFHFQVIYIVCVA